MTVRLSTGLRNLLCSRKGFSGAFANGEIRIYSGTQPVNADAAPTGTLLGVVTRDNAARTPETPASQALTIAGAAGSVNTVTVAGANIMPGGAVAYDTSAAVTAQRVADAITRAGICSASAAGAVVTVNAPAGTGATWNGLALAATVTTLTATSGGNLAGGVDAVNGLTFADPAGGAVAKRAGENWRFEGAADGTAGWFRFSGNASDAGSVSATQVRLDGSIGATGDMTLANNSITTGAPNTIDAFSFTMPAQ